MGAAGALALHGCNLGGGEPDSSVSLPPGVDEPAPRPSLRLASPETGFPSPFAYGPGTHSLVLYIYDTLLVRNADGALVEWLATRFERSDDGRTYTFEVREDARWHDGEPVTAEDVAFSFEYFLEHEDTLPPTVLFPPRRVTEARATGPRSGEIRLDQPWAAFADEVGTRFPIVPRHVWADIEDPVEVTDPQVLVGSGPYRLEELDLTAGAYRFVAHDEFWMGTPFVERIQLTQVDDSLIALRAGELDAGEPSTGTPARDVVPVFQREPKFGVVEGDPDFFVALSWNLEGEGPPADVDFRQACAHAVDRSALLERVVGVGEPGNPGFLPPNHPFHHGDVPEYAHDPDEAERLLDEAGYTRNGDGVRETPDGEPLRLTLLTQPDVAPAAELVRDALSQVGIELEFEPTDFMTAVMTGALDNYEMALLFFGGLERDPDLLRQIFSSRTEGEHIFHSLGWRNDDFDELAEQQARTLDEDERREHLARMQELIAEDLPMLPLYYAANFLMYDREVFTEWSLDVEAKQLFATGKADGEPPVRPIADEGGDEGGSS